MFVARSVCVWGVVNTNWMIFMLMNLETKELPVMILLGVIIPTSVRRGVGDNVSPQNS